MKKLEEIKSMGWEEFAALEEVQIDQTPTGYGTAMFYNDGNIQAWVKIDERKNHDDITVWQDEELLSELQDITVESLVEQEEGENKMEKQTNTFRFNEQNKMEELRLEDVVDTLKEAGCYSYDVLDHLFELDMEENVLTDSSSKPLPKLGALVQHSFQEVDDSYNYTIEREPLWEADETYCITRTKKI